MSLQHSRYQGQNVVNAYNFFIDTAKAAVIGDGRSTGDNYMVHLGDNAISAGDGEIIRLSLVNFNMFNNIYNVNLNNDKFRVTTIKGADVSSTEVVLPRKNYKTIGAIAEVFGAALKNELLAQSILAGSSADDVTLTTLPASNTTIEDTDDRLIDVSMTFTRSGSATAHNLTDVFIQCFRQVSDSFALLGGVGVDSQPPDIGATTVPTENSFKITKDTNTIRVQGFFPAQRLTDRNVYLRCSANSNALESVVLGKPTANESTGRYDNDVEHSYILAKIKRKSEFISFDTGSSDEFFINLQQRKLSTFRLYLTDARNRPLARLANHDTISEGTASGLVDSSGNFESKEQNTKGNLFFDCVIKVEIVKVRDPRMLETTPPPPPMPAREAQSILTWEDYGRPRF